MSALGTPARSAIARRVAGPSALGDDFRRFLRLTWTLAVTQFRLKFYGSFLGYLWQLMRPLMLFGVLYLVFTEFVRFGGAIDFFAPTLLMSIVLYSFINECVSGCVTALVEREALLRKVEFPRMAIPCAVVLTALMNLGLNLIAVALFAGLSGVQLHSTLWQVPLILAVLTAFSLGIGLLVSALYVRFRDVAPISDVFLQMLFYGSPVIYTLELIEDVDLKNWVLINPFAVVLQSSRHAVMDPTVDGAFGFGGWQPYVALIMVALILVAGLVVFRRRAPYVAEDL